MSQQNKNTNNPAPISDDQSVQEISQRAFYVDQEKAIENAPHTLPAIIQECREKLAEITDKKITFRGHDIRLSDLWLKTTLERVGKMNKEEAWDLQRQLESKLHTTARGEIDAIIADLEKPKAIFDPITDEDIEALFVDLEQLKKEVIEAKNKLTPADLKKNINVFMQSTKDRFKAGHFGITDEFTLEAGLNILFNPPTIEKLEFASGIIHGILAQKDIERARLEKDLIKTLESDQTPDKGGTSKKPPRYVEKKSTAQPGGPDGSIH